MGSQVNTQQKKICIEYGFDILILYSQEPHSSIKRSIVILR